MPASTTYGAELERTKRLLGWLLAAVVTIAASTWALGWATPVDVALMVAFPTIVAAMGFYAQHRIERILGAEITRRRDAEQEARAADMAKSRFLATMSHELRTPLVTVIGTTDLLLAAQPAEDVRAHLEVIETAAEALRALIDDVLDFAKLETGKLRFASIDFRLREMIDEVRDLIAPRARQKGLALEVIVADDVPQAMRGDPARLRQVLLNLAGNAVKFTAEGWIEIRVTRLGGAAGGDSDETYDGGRSRLRFAVADTGIGIAPEARDRVFDSFFQGDSSDARRAGGSGLGLAISKDLVAGMGGEIGVTSEHGAGSTFFFELPWRAPRAGVPAAAPAGDAGAASPDVRARFRVLVVDDHATNRRLARAQLEALGYRAAEAADGATALALLDAENENGIDAVGIDAVGIDAVLLDCQMPRLDGYETARRWRHRERERGARRVPIIAITAHRQRGERERCLAVGMDDYLAKPFRHAELAAALDCWLGISRPPGDDDDDVNGDGSLLAERVDTLRREGRRRGRDVLGETVEDFLRRGRKHLDAMRRALAERDAGAFAAAAHDLSGSSAMMGDEALADLAARLEGRGRAGAGDGLEALATSLAAVEAAFERFAETLAPYRPDAARRSVPPQDDSA